MLTLTAGIASAAFSTICVAPVCMSPACYAGSYLPPVVTTPISPLAKVLSNTKVGEEVPFKRAKNEVVYQIGAMSNYFS